MSKEKALDNKVLNYLNEIGAWGIKYWAGAKYTKKGIPDILVCIKGHFFGIEDKKEDGKPTLLQLKNLEWIRNAGGYGILLYPDDFENFKNFVERDFAETTWYKKNIELQNNWQIKLKNV